MLPGNREPLQHHKHLKYFIMLDVLHSILLHEVVQQKCNNDKCTAKQLAKFLSAIGYTTSRFM
jgi:hypothetical protein